MDDFGFDAGVANAQAQAPVVIGAQLVMNVAQAVVARMAAGAFVGNIPLQPDEVQQVEVQFACNRIILIRRAALFTWTSIKSPPSQANLTSALAGSDSRSTSTNCASCPSTPSGITCRGAIEVGEAVRTKLE